MKVAEDGGDPELYNSAGEDLGNIAERLFNRILEVPDAPRSLLVLLDEFPQATVQDWWLAFSAINHESVPLHWYGETERPIVAALKAERDIGELVRYKTRADWTAFAGRLGSVLACRR